MDKTIDERLEALTQSVELLAGMQVRSDMRLDRLTLKVGALTDRMDDLTLDLDRLTRNVENLTTNMAKFLLVVEDHHVRIEKLEGAN
jgi:hypothetical protein